MGKVFKQGAWNTVLLFFGIGIGFINEFILLRNVLESDEVGLLKILMQIAPIIVQLSSIGGVSILIRYFPKFKNRDSSHGGILFGVLSLAHLGFLFVGSLLFLFRNEIETAFGAKAPLFAEYYYLLFPISLFLLNFFIIEAYSRVNFRTVVPIFLNEVLLRLLVSISILFYAFDLISLHNFFIAFTVANCIMPILLAGWLYYKGDLYLKHVKAFFDKALFSQILKFGVYTMLSGFGARLYLNIDSIMIGKYMGLTAVAVYALGMYLSAMIIAPGRAIMRVAQPLVSEFINDNKIKEMGSLYKKVSINNLITCGGLYLLVQAGLPAVMTFIQDQKLYAGTIMVFNILGLSRVYIMAASVNGAIIGNSIYYRFILYSNIVTVFIAIGFNMLLIPKFGINGAAIASLITIASYTTTWIVYVWLKFKVFPFSYKSAAVLLIGVLTWLITSNIPALGDQIIGSSKSESTNSAIWIDSIIRAIIVCLLFGIPVLKLNLSEDLSDKYNKLVKRLF